MPLLMIACPVTRRAVPTNKSVRAEKLATTDLGVNTVGPCPYCGGNHTWTMQKAFPIGTPAHLWPRATPPTHGGG